MSVCSGLSALCQGRSQKKSATTKGCSGGGSRADEGQSNAECKVRKGLKGEDEAQGKIRQVNVSRLPKVLHVFVRDKRRLGVCVCV